MVLYKVLILLNLVFIIQSSACSQNYNETKMSTRDTIIITNDQYESLKDTLNTIDILITDEILIDNFTETINPIIVLDIYCERLKAKGISIYSSSQPEDCELLFTVDSDKKVILYDRRLVLRKINSD